MKKYFLWTVALVAVLAISANAALVDYTGEYSVFVAGDFDGYSKDARGKIAAGGNVTLDSYEVGREANLSQFSLISGGNVSLYSGGGGQIVNGGIYADGNVELDGYTIFGDVVATGAVNKRNDGEVKGSIEQNSSMPSPINFGAAHAELISISEQLAAMSPTGSIETNPYSYRVSFNGTGDDLTVFNLTGDQLNNAREFFFNLDADEKAIINVSGLSHTVGSFGWLTPDQNNEPLVPENLLFNFYESTQIDLTSSFTGSILAPYASLGSSSDYGGQLNGGFYGDSFNGNVEFHLHPYDPEIPEVPEPATLSYLFVGFLSMAAAFKMRRKN